MSETKTELIIETIAEDGTTKKTDQNGKKIKELSKKECLEKQKNKNEDKLITWNELTPYQQEKKKELLQKPSKTATEKKKSMQEISKLLLAKEISRKNVNEVLGNEFSELLVDTEINLYTVCYMKMIQEAAKGNVKAFEIVRDTAGFVKGQEQEQADVMTDADRKLIDNVIARIRAEK